MEFPWGFLLKKTSGFHGILFHHGFNVSPGGDSMGCGGLQLHHSEISHMSSPDFLETMVTIRRVASKNMSLKNVTSNMLHFIGGLTLVNGSEHPETWLGMIRIDV